MPPYPTESTLASHEHTASHLQGSNEGLKAYVIAQLVSVSAASEGSSKRGAQVPGTLKVRRFYRPEDVSTERAYSADWWEVYAGSETTTAKVVDVEDVCGKCCVVIKGTKGIKAGGELGEVCVCFGVAFTALVCICGMYIVGARDVQGQAYVQLFGERSILCILVSTFTAAFLVVRLHLLVV